MLTRQKKKVKGIFIVSIFISTILFANIYGQFLFNPIINQNNGLFQENEEVLRYSYQSDLSDYEITGIGTSQEVRAFFSNQSESLDNTGSFNISAPANNMKLSYGDFNFTFQNNYTTEYIIEDDSALYPEDHIQTYEFDTNHFNLTLNIGTTLDSDKGELVDSSTSTSWILESSSGRLNFTIDGNFTGATDINGYPQVVFNRNNILGIINFLTCQINESSASLTVRMKNYSDSTWITVVNNVNVSTNSGIHDINEIVINENLHYIDLNDECHVEFVFEKNTTGEFELDLYEVSLQSTMGFELDITDTDYVALEFDLRGVSTRVNGFYAWIRTLNVTEAIGKTLNISLYKADGLIARTASNLRTEGLINPNYSLLIDNIMVPYSADNLSYFEFNLENTTDLSFYNYFIVIKSDAPEGVYSIVTIPYNQYGDPEVASKATEHLLKKTNDDGASWENADATVGAHTSGQLDASSFKLNITRGVMPSDFSGNLTIQYLELEDKGIEFYPFVNNDPQYDNEWGKGTWTFDFTTAIPGDLNNDFQVILEWDQEITNGFEFNVSYSVEAYKIESAASTYKVKYDQVPLWNLSYSFNPTLLYWNFTEFWFIYPTTMTPHNLYNVTNPGSSDFFTNTEIKSFSENTNFNIYNASSTLITGSSIGLFSLNLTSFNCIDAMHGYINFDGTLWETRGFMYGDNISLAVDLQNTLGLAPIGGNANATLFQDGTEYGSLYSTNGIVSSNDNILYYDFGNQSILDVTTSDELGSKYYVGYFWTNGTEIGCKKMLIYLETYDAIIDDCTYLSYSDMNSLTGTTTDSLYNNYSLLIASVNETTSIPRPGYYPVSNLNVNEDFTYNIPSSPMDLTVSVLTFEQSENILNPEENVNFKIQLKNLDDVFSFNVKVKVQFVSYANNEWIINETTSNAINLKPIGEAGNTEEFDVDVIIPTLDTNTKVWRGLNSPVRMGGVQTICTVYIEYDGNYHDVGSYTCSNNSLIISQKENNFEGHILALETREEYDEGIFRQDFERDVCLYSQSGLNSTFIINSYTRFYTSSYNQTIESFPLKLNSKFNGTSTNPENIYGDIFNISSTLMTEFGSILSGKNVTCQYKNGSSWENLSSQKTDTSGMINFEINTTTINAGNSFDLKFFWLGNDTIENCSAIIPINKVIQSNDIDFTFSISTYIIYKNSFNSLTVHIINNGTATMIINVNSINVDVTGSLSTTLYYNAIEMQNLEPGESTKLVIEIYCGDVSFNQININISIEAQNVLSLETCIFKSSIISLEVIDSPFFYNLSFLISIFILSAIIAAWFISIFYARSTRKNIKSSLEKPLQKPKPRRGRYVKVSELEPVAKETKPDDLIDKESEDDKSSKQTTDLDSLLEEKGLREKTPIAKKKTQTTQPKRVDSKTPKTVDPAGEKLNKMNIDRLRRYCKDRKIKISSNDTKSQIIQKILDSKKKKK